ncbi:MAG: hydrogenase maturation protease [Schleiferiaceae bacterium]|jgi:hydrogenase maturation protease
MKTAILGFGNPVRSDDAIGVEVIKSLEGRFADRDDVTLFDMGTSAFEVLFKLNGHDRIIMVDAVINSGHEVGALFKVPAMELAAEPKEDPMVFLHSMKWDQALSYARKIMRDDFPSDIDVYLIAIENTRLEVQLSEVVKAAGDKVVEKIIEDVEGRS